MAEVESFTLDHTAVKAPYVRLIGVEQGPRGDEISNFDVRFVQPNEGEIPTAGLHTIEHLLASLLRDRVDGVIDISPFGCRTGFHLIMWGRPEVAGARRGDHRQPALHRREGGVERRARRVRRGVRQLPRPQPAQRPRVVGPDPRSGHQPRRLRARPGLTDPDCFPGPPHSPSHSPSISA